MVHVLQVCTFQVGSFNYAMDKLIFDDEFIPVKEEAVRSILDYEIEIYPLDAEEKQYSALNMNYSVAGFKLVLARKMSFYVVTYYLPSGLFVVVSWISFLVNPEVRSHPRFCHFLKIANFSAANCTWCCPMYQYCKGTKTDQTQTIKSEEVDIVGRYSRQSQKYRYF